MRKQNKRINLVPLACKIVYGEHDEKLDRKFLNTIRDINIADLTDASMIWAQQALEFLELNNSLDRVKFILIKECKLKLFVDFVSKNEYLKDILIENALQTADVLKENEKGAKIYKQYVPTADTPFYLPEKGELGQLTVICYDDDGNEYSATVEINDVGIVQRILKDLELQDTVTSTVKFDDIYTDILTDILNYDENNNEESPCAS